MSFNENLNEVFQGKTVLITGHTGFKGSWLTKWLLQKGAKIIGASKDIPTNPSLFHTLELASEIEHNILDIRDTKKTKEIIIESKPDFIFHLAAQPIVSLSYSDPIDTLMTNAIGTASVLEGIRSLTNKCVVIVVTSDKCYENVEWVWGYKETDRLGGKDIYSSSKAAAEIIYNSFFHSYLKGMSNIRIASVRAGNVIGGGDWAEDRIVPDCIRSWSQHKKVELRRPYATRPWQHVLEPLSGYLQLAMALWNDNKHNGDSFNFGPISDNNITVLELISRLSKTWNFENHEDSFSITNQNSFQEAGLLKLNCDKAIFHLKWTPTLDIQELIEYTGDWYYRFYNEPHKINEFTFKQIADYEQKIAAKNLSLNPITSL
ncbi:CDP-glucose 4,6-dehydratase [Cecembia calidifontis]|jgi:CDP-glucose 4,6-dehydratase|uniref:CDP-glucose 4,6-dehydratase n=1 Tax=Cecembia calidifontis TaxID=1187080 RepID=A0A4V2F6N8_9BACT|nr:CDP-glucose 4,6-dehydratase [Cecembia calidifontis]RZS96969.1 CDP-glucose 4,6-dehydratase [Cecembia calidifontis]